MQISTSAQLRTPTSEVLAALDDARAWQRDLYKRLHQQPELSFREHKTAAEMGERLRSFGFEVVEGIGGTGVIGTLRNGPGASVLMRAELDALPVTEQTGLPYASHVEDADEQGQKVGVAHVCGHDMHMACLLGAAFLLATGRDQWSGTAVALFQPGEERGTGAETMVKDHLANHLDKIDVAFAQHLRPLPAGLVYCRPGVFFSEADSIKVTLFGRGSHGSRPQSAVDPIVIAAMVVLRLQTIVSREIAPSEPAVVTVGKMEAGIQSNVIDDHAELFLNIRSYNPTTQTQILDAIRRMVIAECQASASPRAPQFETYGHFPLTNNDDASTKRVRAAFDAIFGDDARDLPAQPESEDFGNIPDALGVPYVYWGIGAIDPALYRKAEVARRVEEDIPVNHSPRFSPVIEPTLSTGTKALVAASMAWLVRS